MGFLLWSAPPNTGQPNTDPSGTDPAHRVACSAHVPRAEATPRPSSFTSLRRPPDALGRARLLAPLQWCWIGAVGRSAERSKGGGVGRRPTPGDMSAAERPADPIPLHLRHEIKLHRSMLRPEIRRAHRRRSLYFLG